MEFTVPNSASKTLDQAGAEAYMAEIDEAVSKLGRPVLIGGHIHQGASSTFLKLLGSVLSDGMSLPYYVNVNPQRDVMVAAAPASSPRVDRVGLSIPNGSPVYLTGVEGSGEPPKYPDLCMPIARINRYPSDGGMVGAGQVTDERCRLDMFSGKTGIDYVTAASKMECYPAGSSKAYAIGCKYGAGSSDTFVPPDEARFLRLTVVGGGGGSGGFYTTAAATTVYHGGGGGGGAVETFMCVAQTLTITGGGRGSNGDNSTPGVNNSTSGTAGGATVVSGSKGFYASVAGGGGGVKATSSGGGAGAAGGVAAYGGISGEAGAAGMSATAATVTTYPALKGRSGLISDGCMFDMAPYDNYSTRTRWGGGGSTQAHLVGDPAPLVSIPNDGCVFVEWM